LLELLYPFCTFLLCYAFVRSRADIFSVLGAFNWYAVLLCGLIPLNYVLFGYNELNVLDYARVMSTSLLPAFFLFFATGMHRSFVWFVPAAVLLAIPILTISRGVTAAILVALTYYAGRMLLAQGLHKQFVLVVLLAIGGSYGVITSTAFQERSIAEGIIDPLDEGLINTSGRLRIWMHFYEKITTAHPFQLLIGEGLGASDEFTVESDETDWFRQPHSEYIRFLYNTGLIGTVLYFGMFSCLARRIRKNSRNSGNMWLYGASLLTVYSLFVLSLYENFLLYNPFGFTQNAFVLFALTLRMLKLDETATRKEGEVPYVTSQVVITALP